MENEDKEIILLLSNALHVKPIIQIFEPLSQILHIEIPIMY